MSKNRLSLIFQKLRTKRASCTLSNKHFWILSLFSKSSLGAHPFLIRNWDFVHIQIWHIFILMVVHQASLKREASDNSEMGYCHQISVDVWIWITAWLPSFWCNNIRRNCFLVERVGHFVRLTNGYPWEISEPLKEYWISNRWNQAKLSCNFWENPPNS